jgi:hypothetical protein
MEVNLKVLNVPTLMLKMNAIIANFVANKIPLQYQIIWNQSIYLREG